MSRPGFYVTEFARIYDYQIKKSPFVYQEKITNRKESV